MMKVWGSIGGFNIGIAAVIYIDPKALNVLAGFDLFSGSIIIGVILGSIADSFRELTK